MPTEVDPLRLLEEICQAQQGFKDSKGVWVGFKQAPPEYQVFVDDAENLYDRSRFEEAATELAKALTIQRRANVEFFLELTKKTFWRDKAVLALIKRAEAALLAGRLDDCVAVLSQDPLYYAD